MGTAKTSRVDQLDVSSKLLAASSNGGKQEPRNVERLFDGGRKRYQCLASLCAALIGMQSGITLGWSSPILPYLTSPESFLPELTDDQISWISSLLALGATVGAVPAGKIADRIGRKRTMLLTAVPFAVSWITLVTTGNVGGLYAARFVGGIGSGMSCVLVPVYIGEIAEASIRGALGALFPLLFSSGIVFSYVAGAYCSYVTFNVMCCAVLMPFVVGGPFIPESPMWLVQCDRKVRASRNLSILRGSYYDIAGEIAVLQDDADRTASARGGLEDLVGTYAGRRAAVACMGVMLFQQLSGVDAVLFYTVNIFQAADSTIDPFLATIVVGSTEIVMTIVVAAVIDRFGRKPLLIISGAGMTVCLGVLGYYFKLKDAGDDVSAVGWLPLTCLTVFNIVFSIGYGAVPYTVISEIFPPETKGVASSMAIVVNWSLVFVVTKMFPIMEDRMGQTATFWTFASFSAASVFFVCYLLPETKGKTLQDIQRILERRHSAKSVEPV